MHMRTRWFGWWALTLAWVGYGCGSEEKTARPQPTTASTTTGLTTTSGSGAGGASGVGTNSSTTGIMTTTGSGTGGGGNMEDPTTCMAAAAGRTYVGCEFWPTVTYNPVYSVFDFAVVVANAGTQPA